MVVLDASVILKWVLPAERGAEAAHVLWSRHQRGLDPVAVPDLFFYEAANALALTRRFTEGEARSAWDKLARAKLDAYPPDALSLQRAMALSREAGISVYDASYIALAEELGCNLTTADLKLIRKTEHVDLACTIRPLVQGVL